MLTFFHPIVSETGCSPTEIGYRDGNVCVKLTVFCYVYKSLTLARPGKKNSLLSHSYFLVWSFSVCFYGQCF